MEGWRSALVIRREELPLARNHRGDRSPSGRTPDEQSSASFLQAGIQLRDSWAERLGGEGAKTALVALLLCCAPLSQACGGVARFDGDGSTGSGGSHAIDSSGGSASLSMGGSVRPQQGGLGAGGFISLTVGGSGAGGPIAPPQGGSGPVAPPQGGSGPVGPIGSVSEGAQVWTKQSCASCHQENAAGNYGPNITPSLTAGIGTWTYQQFHDAVRDGKDPGGTALCQSMSRFPAKEISDEDMVNLYAYLRSKPAVDIANTGLFCP